MSRKIIFYRTIDDKCPIEDFLDSLPAKVTQKITWTLELIENHDIIPANYFKKLVNTDLWECRVQVGSNIYRLICFFSNNSIIVLTHGFQKKTQKTPFSEIEKGIKLMNEYKKRGKS
jgi:phage-related protein